MGLDNYACIRRGDKLEPMPNSLFAANHLVSGMFSMDTNSFRGKAYNDYVQYVTGQSLYQELIEECAVVEMAKRLKKFADNAFAAEPGFEARNIYGLNKDVAEDLANWFQTVANNNGVVVGWW